jgi:hypothetical protein
MVGTTFDMKGRNMSNVGSLGVRTMRSRIARRPIESDDEAAVEDRQSSQKMLRPPRYRASLGGR